MFGCAGCSTSVVLEQGGLAYTEVCLRVEQLFSRVQDLCSTGHVEHRYASLMARLMGHKWNSIGDGFVVFNILEGETDLCQHMEMWRTIELQSWW